jgi:hypothetical protein
MALSLLVRESRGVVNSNETKFAPLYPFLDLSYALCLRSFAFLQRKWCNDIHVENITNGTIYLYGRYLPDFRNTSAILVVPRHNFLTLYDEIDRVSTHSG